MTFRRREQNNYNKNITNMNYRPHVKKEPKLYVYKVQAKTKAKLLKNK